tara:strand:+ start:105 stop:614 length:510 start_codon:yes stop_codon:yes gene_type:complete
VKKKQLVHIGSFGRPLGLKGEVKIIVNTFEFNTIKSMSSYLINERGSIWNFQYLKIRKDKLIGKFQECNSRNCVEKLTGKKIFIDKSNLPKIKKNQFYVIDLINSKVKTINNKLLGNIINIDNFGAGDLINIKKTNNKSFYIPMNEENIVKVDIKKKLVIVNPIKGILD